MLRRARWAAIAAAAVIGLVLAGASVLGASSAPDYSAEGNVLITTENDPQVAAITNAAIGKTAIVTARWQADDQLKGGFYMLVVAPPSGWYHIAMAPQGGCCAIAWNAGAEAAEAQLEHELYEFGAMVPATAEGEAQLVFNAKPWARAGEPGPWQAWLVQEQGNDLVAVEAVELAQSG